MIDIQLLRADKGGDPELVRESQRRRHARVELVDEAIDFDKRWVKADFELNGARKERNALSKEFGALKKAGKSTDELTARLNELKERIATLEREAQEYVRERDRRLQLIGNVLPPEVPTSDNEDDNVVRALHIPADCVNPPPEALKPGEEAKPRPDWLLNHVAIFQKLHGTDCARGARIAGNRGYFLTGPGVLLNYALIQYGIKFLTERGYTPVQPPFMMRKECMAKCAQLSEFDEMLYKVVGDADEDDGAGGLKTSESYLIATSEQPMTCLHMDETLTLPAGEVTVRPAGGDERKLAPQTIRYCGISTCFRKETGRHGVDTLGIFRIHQFEKIEQFCITTNADGVSWRVFDEMIGNAKEFYESLGIGYRVVDIVSGALNNAAARKNDLEAWFPGHGAFRELVSCSNCTDYQSRNLEVHQPGRTKDGRPQYVHMLNSTLTATERTLCCLVETHQTPTGVRVPAPLQPYVGTDFLPYLE